MPTSPSQRVFFAPKSHTYSLRPRQRRPPLVMNTQTQVFAETQRATRWGGRRVDKKTSCYARLKFRQPTIPFAAQKLYSQNDRPYNFAGVGGNTVSFTRLSFFGVSLGFFGFLAKKYFYRSLKNGVSRFLIISAYGKLGEWGMGNGKSHE